MSGNLAASFVGGTVFAWMMAGLMPLPWAAFMGLLMFGVWLALIKWQDTADD